MIAETLYTGFGAWNPIVWLIALAVALLFAWFIQRLGEPDIPGEGESGKSYISGNDEPSPEDGHIGGSNLYWGFTEAMKGYYARVVPLHTGCLTDYVLWFLGTFALLFILIGVI